MLQNYMFTSLCKIFIYLSNQAGAFHFHVHHYQCLTVPVELAVIGFVFWFSGVGTVEMLVWLACVTASKSV